MSSVDDRIVNMQFNNRQFSAGVTDSQRSLQSLEAQLAKTGSSQGLGTMADGVAETTSRFGALKIAGISAIATIASKATTAGLSLIKSFTLDPITQGFTEYQTNLNSIQTILANTGAPLKEVNANLQALNHYSDSTIYNFGQMASAIGKFTAAGVNLDDATSAIKGMANSAALSGASVDQLNSAMYQMSQALASGTIRLMDWNSLVNANMGGVNMQKSLEATAMTMKDNGAAMLDATTAAGNFRDSLQAGWLSADIFSKTMKVMGGQNIKTSGSVKQINDELLKIGYTSKEAAKAAPELKKTGGTIAFTVKQLQQMGYSKEAAQRLNELSDAAIHSAQDIKTLPQLLDVIKEAIGSGWSKIFQDVFGNFNQSKKMWTSVGTTIQGVIGNIFGAVDAMLVGWRKLGGYEELWASFGNIFKALGNIIHPFLAAFAAITPGTAKAGSTMFTLTHAFFLFTEMLVKVTDGLNTLTPGFTQVGRIIGLVFQQFSGLGSVVDQLAPVFDKLSGSLGGLAQQGGDIASGILQGIIAGLSGGAIRDAITSLASNIIDWIKGALGIHSPAQTMIYVGQMIIQGIVQGLVQGLPAIINGVGKVVGAVFKAIFGLFSGFNAMDFASLLNAIFTGGLLLALSNATHTFAHIGNSISNIIDGIGNSFQAWQNALKAKMILDIAIAVGILVAALVLLSTVNPKKLAIGLGAIASLLATLSATLFALGKIDTETSLVGLAASITLISFAMIQFAAALVLLGKQDMATIEKGLGAMAAILTLLVGAMLGFSKISGSVEGMAGSIFVIAAAMNLLATAVLALGSLDMKTLEKGLGAIGVGLALMTGSLIALAKLGSGGSIEGAAASMLLMAAAMNVMAAAVFTLGSMDMKTLEQGMTAVAIGLGIMVGALLLLSDNTAGVVAAGASMVLMATAMNMLVGVILVLGTAPWQTVAKGLTFVAIALGIFLVAGALAIGVAPGLEVLGTSLLMLGAAMFLAGTGMAAFGTGFALLAATGAAGTAVLIATIHALLAILPEIAVQAAASFIAFMKVIANAGAELRPILGKIISTILGVITDNIPKIVHTAVVFVSELLKGIRQLIPQFGKLISTLIRTGLDVLTHAVPQYVNAGTTIVVKILQGMANNLPKMVTAAGNLIARFITALGNEGVHIVNAAGKTILKFLDGVDQAVKKYGPDITRKTVQIGEDIVAGVVQGLTSSVSFGKITSAVGKLTSVIPDKIKGFLGIGSPAKTMIPLGQFIVEGLAKGISDHVGIAIAAVLHLAEQVIAAGDKVVAKAQRAAQKAQTRAYAAQAKADVRADEARDAAKFARQHKKDKEAQKRAKAAQKAADAAQKRADAVQKAADAAGQHVQNVQTFRQADLHGKGDIRNQQAVDLADKANKQLQRANAEAARARELMKTNQAAGRAMLKQARKDAKAAAELAKRARQAHKDAQHYYAMEVDERIKQLEKDAAADEKAKKDQEAYDAADAQGKSDILTKRAEADELKAKQQKELAKQLMEKARKIAKTDAARAMKLLDRAEAASQKAKDAADQAAQERDQAQQVLSEGSTGSGGVDTLAPSRTVLEDAAKAVDRYTQSLIMAQALSAADQGVIQFTQNNYSPEALSASEVYRQSKNLLSAAELKMGATTSP